MIVFFNFPTVFTLIHVFYLQAYAAAQGAQANALVGHVHGQGSYTTVQKTISHVSSTGSRY